MQALVDGGDQTDVVGEFVEQGDAAESGAIDAIVKLVVEVATAAKDGLGAVREFGFVETALDGLMACAEFVAKGAVAFCGFALAAVLALASGGFLV
jgi:hypothetical protein